MWSPAAAGKAAARHADVYLTWGEPPVQVQGQIDWVRALSARGGRTVHFGIRLHTIPRDSSAEAWATANGLLDDLDADTIAATRAVLGRPSESVRQGRMLEPHGASRGRLEIHPNLRGDRTRHPREDPRPDHR